MARSLAGALMREGIAQYGHIFGRGVGQVAASCKKQLDAIRLGRVLWRGGAPSRAKDIFQPAWLGRRLSRLGDF